MIGPPSFCHASYPNKNRALGRTAPDPAEGAAWFPGMMKNRRQREASSLAFKSFKVITRQVGWGRERRAGFCFIGKTNLRFVPSKKSNGISWVAFMCPSLLVFAISDNDSLKHPASQLHS